LIENLKIAGGIDLNRDGTPIYVQLAGLFRRRIESGEWPVGSRIPTLDALALEFGVARATIRQTTGLLRQEGLVARYRGRGTIVRRRPQREFGTRSAPLGLDHRGLSAGASPPAARNAARSSAASRLRRRHRAVGLFHIRRLNTIGAEPAAVTPPG
jgi:DNA-binding GntR family transcriptional regulator